MEKGRWRRTRLLGAVAIVFSFCVCWWLFAAISKWTPLAIGGGVSSIATDLHHLPHMQYIINSKTCSVDSGEIYMLVLVGSHPSHVANRNVIRTTWGNPQMLNYQFRLVFLFGNFSEQWQNEALASESDQHGDIIQGDFVDSFYNVTLRDLMGFQWALQHCSRTKYIARADDDIALDIYKLIDRLEDQFENHRSDSICCYEVASGAAPLRSGRYAMSHRDYDDRFYPDYCFGWIYVMTPSVAKQLVDMCESVKAIWINDVYITGILAKASRINLYDLNLKYTLAYDEMVAFGYSSIRNYDIGPIEGNTNLMRTIQDIYTEIYLDRINKSRTRDLEEKKPVNK